MSGIVIYLPINTEIKQIRENSKKHNYTIRLPTHLSKDHWLRNCKTLTIANEDKLTDDLFIPSLISMFEQAIKVIPFVPFGKQTPEIKNSDCQLYVTVGLNSDFDFYAFQNLRFIMIPTNSVHEFLSLFLICKQSSNEKICSIKGIKITKYNEGKFANNSIIDIYYEGDVVFLCSALKYWHNMYYSESFEEYQKKGTLVSSQFFVFKKNIITSVEYPYYNLCYERKKAFAEIKLRKTERRELSNDERKDIDLSKKYIMSNPRLKNETKQKYLDILNNFENWRPQ